MMAAAKLAKDWRLINAALLPAHAPWREGAAASGNLLARARKAGPARAQFRAVREGGEQHDAVGVRRIAQNRNQSIGRSRGGLTSKIHAVVDANGLPVRLGLTPGEAHDNRLCSVLLTGLHPRTMLLADRGYDADWIRALASQQGAWANIPPKRNRKLQPLPLPSGFQ